MPNVLSVLIWVQIVCEGNQQTTLVSKEFMTTDTKHIRRDFNSVAMVMPQGLDFGALGVPRGSKKIFSDIVMWHIK